MRKLMVLAMILGSGAFAQGATSHHPVHIRPDAQNFMGLVGSSRSVAPPYDDLDACNGGPCTLTGGPSGGPNQS